MRNVKNAAFDGISKDPKKSHICKSFLNTASQVAGVLDPNLGKASDGCKSIQAAEEAYEREIRSLMLCVINKKNF